MNLLIQVTRQTSKIGYLWGREGEGREKKSINLSYEINETILCKTKQKNQEVIAVNRWNKS